MVVAAATAVATDAVAVAVTEAAAVITATMHDLNKKLHFISLIQRVMRETLRKVRRT